MSIIDNYLWVSKYRPKEIDDVILDDVSKKSFQHFLDTNNIPHCLLVGKPGTGKTTIGMILMNKIARNKNDRLFMNASDERGIQSMRNTVIEFMKTPPYSSPQKIVLMDESDNLTNDAWLILRNPIENDNVNVDQQTRFIFTANYLSKIPDFMKSRCAVFEFTFPPRDYAIETAKYILDQEKVEYDDENLMSLIDTHYPDLRSIINTMQRSTFDNKLVYKMTVSYSTDLANKTIAFINKQDQTNIKQEIGDIRTTLHDFDIDVVETTKQILNQGDIPLPTYIVLNRYLNTFNNVLDKNAHFIAMLYECVLFNIRYGSK